MTDFLSFGIWDRAESRAQKVRLLRLGIFAEAEASWKHRSGGDMLAVAVSGLASLSFGTLFRKEVPFFWGAVDSCIRQANANEADRSFGAAAQRLVRLTFDSFFSDLPTHFEITIPDAAGDLLTFPELGLRIHSGRPGTLCKHSENVVVFDARGERVIINIGALAPSFRLGKLPIPGCEDAQLLLDSDSGLFSESYSRDIIMSLDKDEGRELAGAIGKALELLERLDPLLATRIACRIKWYVPLRSPDPCVHLSFSVPRLSGVIFLSQPTTEMRVPVSLKLAEVLVHEFAHNELHLHQESQQLYTEDPKERFYSPWRPDPRPLNGLLHGLYSFWHVAEFFRRAALLESTSHHHVHLRSAHQRVLQQLRIALLQIPSDRLSASGAEIVDVIAKGVAAQLKAPGMPTSFAIDLQAHMTQWRASNPGYAAQIRMG
jgi:HEXXH motif-containing protein